MGRVSGEHGLRACSRRQPAGDIMSANCRFGKLPKHAG